MYKYYVYAYLRDKDSLVGKKGTPFYIGKGQGGRAYQPHGRKLPDPSQIVILERGLSDVGALALERRMIRWYGRVDNKTGILRNLTDGGDGLSNPGQSTRKLIAENQKNIWKNRSQEELEHLSSKMRGRKLSDASRKLVSINHKGMSGKTHSEETKKKMAEARRLYYSLRKST